MTETIGDRIKQARQNAGYSMAYLARRMGVAIQVLDRMERNEGRMTVERAEAVAEALGVRVDWLMTGGPKSPPAANDK